MDLALLRLTRLQRPDRPNEHRPFTIKVSGVMGYTLDKVFYLPTAKGGPGDYQPGSADVRLHPTAQERTATVLFTDIGMVVAVNESIEQIDKLMVAAGRVIHAVDG